MISYFNDFKNTIEIKLKDKIKVKNKKTYVTKSNRNSIFFSLTKAAQPKI